MTVFTVVVELLHEIGRDVGLEDWCNAAHPNNSAADVHQLDHHDFHPSLRPRVRAPGATVHTPIVGHHNAVADSSVIGRQPRIILLILTNNHLQYY
jgi:hypothetical protein